ncbi:MAG TPA: efflux RND transporter periplasmic adaptor subunit [Gammaproteobacteria bacterium]|nr:efflux RND transporter periplasmic adaptor subunit [Gammaproteobacteria bacterium]
MQLSATLSILAVAALLLSACGPTQPASSKQPLPEVTVAHPLVKQIIDWDGYVGQFEPVERVDVRPRVSGYLVKVHFEDGQRVKKGQPLFTIDPRPFQAALDEAKGDAASDSAKLDNARAEVERIRKLAARKLASREDLDAREAAVRAAAADLDAAEAKVRAQQLNLDFTAITAPISGRISYRRVDPGNAVVADNTVLTTIVSVDPIYFEFQSSEALYLKYKRASSKAPDADRTVRIQLQDEHTPRWIGHLVFTDNAIDPNTGTILGRALVDNPDGFLTPGMFGHMQLQASNKYSGLLVPDTAIATRGADRIVYLVGDGGVVSARKVELGPLYEGLRVIRSGLEAEDRVIVNGQQRARIGQNVQIRVAKIEAPAGTGADAFAAADSSSAGASASGAR